MPPKIFLFTVLLSGVLGRYLGNRSSVIITCNNYYISFSLLLFLCGLIFYYRFSFFQLKAKYGYAFVFFFYIVLVFFVSYFFFYVLKPLFSHFFLSIGIVVISPLIPSYLILKHIPASFFIRLR